MSSKNEGGKRIVLKRYYNTKDIVINAMVKSGLENLITNGVTLRYCPQKVQNAPAVAPSVSTAKKAKVVQKEKAKTVAPEEKTQIPDYKLCIDSEVARKKQKEFNLILSELFEMEKSIKNK